MLTQKKRKEMMREIIDRNEYGIEFNEQDVELVNELTGWDYRRYKRMFNVEYPLDTRCIAACVSDDEFIAHSWNKAISGSDKKTLDLNYAMRVAVKDQNCAFLSAANQVCVACGATDDLTADHSTRAFNDIKNEFVASVVGGIDLVNDDAGGGWRISDAGVLSDWQRFHKEHTQYQVLCRSCNSKKGDRN